MSRHVAHCGTYNGEACDCASDYDCSPEDCDCRAPSVPDPVADTARALAGLWAANDREWTDALMGRIPLATANERYTDRALAIEDAARECGPQVFAAFCALVTGDAGREVGNG